MAIQYAQLLMFKRHMGLLPGRMTLTTGRIRPGSMHTDPAVHEILGRAHSALGRLDQAAEFLRQALEFSPHTAD